MQKRDMLLPVVLEVILICSTCNLKRFEWTDALGKQEFTDAGVKNLGSPHQTWSDTWQQKW